jgi:hypothetical protein
VTERPCHPPPPSLFAFKTPVSCKICNPFTSRIKQPEGNCPRDLVQVSKLKKPAAFAQQQQQLRNVMCIQMSPQYVKTLSVGQDLLLHSTRHKRSIGRFGKGRRPNSEWQPDGAGGSWWPCAALKHLVQVNGGGGAHGSWMGSQFECSVLALRWQAGELELCLSLSLLHD